MEAIIIILAVGLAYWLGYKVGGNSTRREIFKALGLKPGYRIDGVHFSKVEK
jgi:hypothetical protein